jgi:hypothetical protein
MKTFVYSILVIVLLSGCSYIEDIVQPKPQPLPVSALQQKLVGTWARQAWYIANEYQEWNYYLYSPHCNFRTYNANFSADLRELKMNMCLADGESNWTILKDNVLRTYHKSLDGKETYEFLKIVDITDTRIKATFNYLENYPEANHYQIDTLVFYRAR